jgi:hypothetical protein
LRKLIYAFIVVIIFYGIYFVPRPHTRESFSNLKYGEFSLSVLAKLGKPIKSGHTASVIPQTRHWYSTYKLSDGSHIYITFSYNFLYLKTCTRYDESGILDNFVVIPE